MLDTISLEETTNISRFDIYVGAGWVSGGRLGIRAYLSDNYSAEVSYGNDIKNFITLSDPEKRYGFGINWHFPKTSWLIISVLSTYNKRIYQDNSSINLSLNIGYLKKRTLGLHLFSRIGLYCQFKKWFNMKEYKLKEIGPNLDIGIGYNFE